MEKILLKEKIQHGDLMFPLGFYSINNLVLADAAYYHWHDEMEFCLATSGSSIIKVEDEYYHAAAGEALFINSGKLHSIIPENEQCGFSSIVFDPQMLYSNFHDKIQSEYIDPFVNNQYRLPVHIKGTSAWEKELLHVLFQLERLLTAKPTAFELVVKAHLFMILHILLANSQYNGTPVSNNSFKAEKIKEILRYLSENYNKKMNINDVANRFNMSSGHFHRFFKQMTGHTPVDYLNHYRVNKAIDSILHSNRQISEIAMDSGFDNISYFNSVFKKYTNTTPVQYRNRR